MISVPSPRQRRYGVILLAGILVSLPAVVVVRASAQQSKVDVLRIGTSGALTGAAESKEKTSLKSLQSFIKDETGLNNKIIRQKDWRELTDKLAKGKLHLGVYQGYEFAWAQEKQPHLKPLAVAVNVYVYPVVYVVVRRDDSASTFSGLQGHSVCLPDVGQRYLHLYLDRQSQAQGKTARAFFSKITNHDNFEDALDDVVDGTVQAAVCDRAALEAYKQRKPGRFKRLKPVAHSQPFPPAVVAYYDAILDEATRDKFQFGLLHAADKEKGQTMLTLFKLTGFTKVPADFERVLADTRKAYPPPKPRTK